MNHLCFKVAIITTVYLEVRSVRTCLWSACCQSSFSLVRSRYNLRKVRNSPKMTSMHLKQFFVKFYENIFLMPTAKSCAGLCWFLYCPACMNSNIQCIVDVNIFFEQLNDTDDIMQTRTFIFICKSFLKWSIYIQLYHFRFLLDYRFIHCFLIRNLDTKIVK